MEIKTGIKNKLGSQNACHKALYRFWKQATMKCKQVSSWGEAQEFLMLRSEKLSSVGPLWYKIFITILLVNITKIWALESERLVWIPALLLVARVTYLISELWNSLELNGVTKRIYVSCLTWIYPGLLLIHFLHCGLFKWESSFSSYACDCLGSSPRTQVRPSEGAEGSW